MLIYKIEVKGMRCGMCEEHIARIIRNNLNPKKVKVSRFRKLAIIKSENELDLDKVLGLIHDSGYEARLLSSEIK